MREAIRQLLGETVSLASLEVSQPPRHPSRSSVVTNTAAIKRLACWRRRRRRPTTTTMTATRRSAFKVAPVETVSGARGSCKWLRGCVDLLRSGRSSQEGRPGPVLVQVELAEADVGSTRPLVRYPEVANSDVRRHRQSGSRFGRQPGFSRECPPASTLIFRRGAASAVASVVLPVVSVRRLWRSVRLRPPWAR